MGISKMQGVPWHIETLTSEDERRHKKWCIYNKNGMCSFYNHKCTGSKNCTKYKYNNDYQKKEIVKKEKYTLYNYYDFKYLKGRFTLEYDDGTRNTFIIGDNIKYDAPIMNKIMETKYGDIFEYNGEKIKLVMKKIKYSEEARKRQNYLSEKILSGKSLDEESNNTTNLKMLKFKIKFLSNNKIEHYKAGSSIRWDDPLVKVIIGLKSGSMFEYKNEKLLLVSKYVREE